MTANIFVKIERRIVATSATDLLERWNFGQELLKAKAGKKKLPDGYLDDRIAELDRAGIRASRRELQYRIRLAEVYGSKAALRKIACTIGSWSEIIAAGFPAVTVDELTDETDSDGQHAPDEWEQLSLIPGLGETLKVGGRVIPLDEATIADVDAYRDMYARIHDNYAKKLAQIEQALQLMRDGAGGDDSANAVDAYKRGIST